MCVLLAAASWEASMLSGGCPESQLLSRASVSAVGGPVSQRLSGVLGVMCTVKVLVSLVLSSQMVGSSLLAPSRLLPKTS